jgi:hypothetical protein
MTTPNNNNTIPPLDWRSSITDQGGRPTPAFQRAWNSQRSINAAAGTVTLGSGVPTVPPAADGSEYVDISTTPFTLYVGSDGSFHQTGVKIFTDLADVPHSYTGSSDFLLRVNSTGTGLEFVSISSVLDGIGSTEGNILYRNSSDWTVLSPGTAGQVLTTGGPGAIPAWAAGGGGGGGQHEYEAFGALPKVADFTTVLNQTGGPFTVTDGTLGLLITAPVNTSQPRMGLLKSAPSSTPWDVYVRVQGLLGNGGHGILLRNSTSTQAYEYSWVNFGELQLATFATYTNTGVTGGSAIVNTSSSIPHINWLRVNNNGTTLTFYASPNGVDWIPFSSQSLAGFITSVDQIGISVFTGTIQATGSVVSSFSTTLPT